MVFLDLDVGGNASVNERADGEDAKGTLLNSRVSARSGFRQKRVIISVKSGHPNVSHIRDLGHVIDRENATIGVYLTLEPPTKPMLEEAAPENASTLRPAGTKTIHACRYSRSRISSTAHK